MSAPVYVFWMIHVRKIRSIWCLFVLKFRLVEKSSTPSCKAWQPVFSHYHKNADLVNALAWFSWFPMFRHRVFLNTDMRKEGAFYSTVVFEYYYIQALNDCLPKTKTEQVFRLLRFCSYSCNSSSNSGNSRLINHLFGFSALCSDTSKYSLTVCWLTLAVIPFRLCVMPNSS